MPPAATATANSPSRGAAAPETVDIDALASTYWEVRDEITAIQRRRKLSSFKDDDRWMEESRQKLRKLNSQMGEIEAYAKKSGLWSAVQARKPVSGTHRPHGAATVTVAARAPVGKVAEVTYGSLSTSSSRPWEQREHDKLFKPTVKRDRVTHGRVWEHELQHTRAMGALMSDYSNLDAGAFRDSHHDPGARRTFTKLIWAGIGMAAETFGIGLSRRLLAGDVPFDFFPARRDVEYDLVYDDGDAED